MGFRTVCINCARHIRWLEAYRKAVGKYMTTKWKDFKKRLKTDKSYNLSIHALLFDFILIVLLIWFAVNLVNITKDYAITRARFDTMTTTEQTWASQAFLNLFFALSTATCLVTVLTLWGKNNLEYLSLRVKIKELEKKIEPWDAFAEAAAGDWTQTPEDDAKGTPQEDKQTLVAPEPNYSREPV